MYENDPALPLNSMHNNLDNDKNYILEENNIVEADWQLWQSLYAVRRRETFQRILDAIRKRLSILS
jgi:hypothetical protein